MTADREHLSLDWGFTVDGTAEIAHTGMSWTRNSGVYLSSAADLASIDIAVTGTALLGAMATLLTNTGGWAGYSKLRTFRMAAVAITGLEIGDAKEFEDSTPATGTADSVPPQCTIVVSMRSGQTTGAANYGRMYLPHTRHGTGDFAVATTTAAAFVGTEFKTFVDGVKTVLDADTGQDMLPVIITNKTGFASKFVTQLGCGRVTDTQRRRRNRLPEETVLVAYP